MCSISLLFFLFQTDNQHHANSRYFLLLYTCVSSPQIIFFFCCCCVGVCLTFSTIFFLSLSPLFCTIMSKKYFLWYEKWRKVCFRVENYDSIACGNEERKGWLIMAYNLKFSIWINLYSFGVSCELLKSFMFHSFFWIGRNVYNEKHF